MISKLMPSAKLEIKRLNVGPGAWWHVRNRVRPSFWLGWLAVIAAKLFTKTTGIPTMTSTLELLNHRRADGMIVSYGVVSYRVITDAFVSALMTDWFDASKDITNFTYHGIGTGTASESVLDSALGTEATTALSPDNIRATGTKTKPATNQLQSLATITVDAAVAMTEQGLFDTAAVGTGTLADRNVFSTVNLAIGDSFQSKHTFTVNSGG